MFDEPSDLSGEPRRLPARFVVYGAGAVGGLIAARLHEAGFDVVAIARGRHLDAIRRDGLRLESPDGEATIALHAVASPGEISWRRGDVAVLTMKSQDTEGALRDLASNAPASVTVICAQNGVANERAASRYFENVLGMWVIVSATHLTPGVVRVESAPCPGILDVGRFPSGSDAACAGVAAALCAAGFDSRAITDIMRWKYAKLLRNLANAVDAICSSRDLDGRLLATIRSEGLACLTAAGIAHVSPAEERDREGDLIRLREVNGETRGGNSTWQSLQRQRGSVEVDYLNGEISLLGGLCGVPTPANRLIQRAANRIAVDRARPRTLDSELLMAELGIGRQA